MGPFALRRRPEAVDRGEDGIEKNMGLVASFAGHQGHVWWVADARSPGTGAVPVTELEARCFCEVLQVQFLKHHVLQHKTSHS